MFCSTETSASWDRSYVSRPGAPLRGSDCVRGDLAVGRGDVRGREDAAADDEEVGSGAVDLADVLRLHAAVDLDVDVRRERRAERRDPVIGLGHELLPRVAGVD